MSGPAYICSLWIVDHDNKSEEQSRREGLVQLYTNAQALVPSVISRCVEGTFVTGYSGCDVR